MKKTFINSVAALALLLGSAALTSCGSDGDDGGSELPGGTEAIEAVNPDKVFNNNPPVKVDGKTVRYDAAGRVVAIGSSCTFTYNDNPEVRKSSEDYNVLMRAYSDNVYICLNKKGFVSYAYTDNHEAVWRIEYNSNDRVSKVYTFYDDSEEDEAYEGNLTFSYTGNNLTSMKGTGSQNGFKVSGTAKMTYTDSKHPNGIPNKDYYFFFNDGVGGYHFNELSYAYYAGMLGIGYDLLPLAFEQNTTYIKTTETYEWTLDGRGYPSSVRCKGEEVYDGESDKWDYNETFSW